MWPNPQKTAQKTADLVRFTGEILNGKLHFLFSKISRINPLIPCEFLKRIAVLIPEKLEGRNVQEIRYWFRLQY